MKKRLRYWVEYKSRASTAIVPTPLHPQTKTTQCLKVKKKWTTELSLRTLANTEVRHPADSTKPALSKDEMDNVVKKLVDMNRTLYRWTTEENFVQDIEKSVCTVFGKFRNLYYV